MIAVRHSLRTPLLLIAASLVAALAPMETAAQETFVLVAGRRLPLLYAVSLDRALEPANNQTPNAIVARSKVALDGFDGRPLGDPANLVVSEDGGSVYVINHHGAIDNAEFRQHGGRGAIAVLDVARALDPANDRTTAALERHIDSGGFGSLGVALLDDLIVVSNAENWLTEDGGNRVTFVDRRTGSLRATVELALGSPDHSCQDYPVPYQAPYGPPRDVAVLSPDPSWGCFPDPNGLAIGQASDGSKYAFTANGGTNDVSVIDLRRVLEGAEDAESHRIPVQRGPWGMTATPDGRHIIVSNGGSQLDGSAGNSLSILDVDRAIVGAQDTEVARVLVGSDDPTQETHPLMAAVTPDGREVIAANIRAGNVSVVSLERALEGDPSSEVARITLTRADGRAARPKGVAVTPDGRYAIVSGGPGLRPYSQEVGYLYVIDLRSREVVATVTGVGNDPYGVAVVVR